MVVGMSWRAVSGTIWGCCGPRKPRKLRLRGERIGTSKSTGTVLPLRRTERKSILFSCQHTQGNPRKLWCTARIRAANGWLFTSMIRARCRTQYAQRMESAHMSAAAQRGSHDLRFDSDIVSRCWSAFSALVFERKVSRENSIGSCASLTCFDFFGHTTKLEICHSCGDYFQRRRNKYASHYYGETPWMSGRNRLL